MPIYEYISPFLANDAYVFLPYSGYHRQSGFGVCPIAGGDPATSLVSQDVVDYCVQDGNNWVTVYVGANPGEYFEAMCINVVAETNPVWNGLGEGGVTHADKRAGMVVDGNYVVTARYSVLTRGFYFDNYAIATGAWNGYTSRGTNKSGVRWAVVKSGVNSYRLLHSYYGRLYVDHFTRSAVVTADTLLCDFGATWMFGGVLTLRTTNYIIVFAPQYYYGTPTTQRYVIAYLPAGGGALSSWVVVQKIYGAFAVPGQDIICYNEDVGEDGYWSYKYTVGGSVELLSEDYVVVAPAAALEDGTPMAFAVVQDAYGDAYDANNPRRYFLMKLTDGSVTKM